MTEASTDLVAGTVSDEDREAFLHSVGCMGA